MHHTGSRLSRYLLLLSLFCVLKLSPGVSIAIAETIKPKPPLGPCTFPGQLPPDCSVTNVGVSIERWKSYGGPFADNDVQLGSILCLFYSEVYHPILRLDIELSCPKQKPETQTLLWRFHGGGDSNGPMRPLSNEGCERGDNKILPIAAPIDFPSTVTPEELTKFLNWYNDRYNDNKGLGVYCANPSAGDFNSCGQLNCGGAFLIWTGRLLGKSPSEVADKLHNVLGPCKYFAWELAGDSCQFNQRADSSPVEASQPGDW